jgi:hypothetical protein
MIHGGRIRIWRGQVHPPDEEDEKSDEEVADERANDVAEVSLVGYSST